MRSESQPGDRAREEAEDAVRREHEPRGPEREPAHVVEVDDDERERDPVPEGVDEPAGLHGPDGARKPRVDAAQIAARKAADQPSPRVAQTSSFDWTRPITSSVNSRGRGVAAEVGRADPGGDRLERGLADRPARSARHLVVHMGEERGGGEDHRHRVGDVLAVERGRGPVGGLGHESARRVVLVEGDEQRLRPRDRAEERQDEVGEDVPVAIERRDDERVARRADQERESRVDELRLVRDLGMALGGGVHLLLEHALVDRADGVLGPAEDLCSRPLGMAKGELGDGAADAPLDLRRAEGGLVLALALAPLLRAVGVADRHSHDRDGMESAADGHDARESGDPCGRSRGRRSPRGGCGSGCRRRPSPRA